MSVLGNPLLLGPEGYQISRSVRLRSSASAYFNRTFSSGANETTSTLSLWCKRGKIGAQQTLMGVAGGGSNEADLFFDGGDTLTFASWNGGSRPLGIITTSAVYRDPSAWYHIVFVVNTTTATTNDRLVLYVNGVRQALSVNTQPSQNAVWYWNGAYAHRLGAYANTLQAYLDGYITEVNFIDGQALTPSSFGETDSITGVWKPKKYVGTYGTNGFYLNFSDNSAATAAAIGKDNSGNGNNWTPNNISVTAGVTYDSMIDVPTLYADGGNGRGNYCTWNPLKANGTVFDGNLALTGGLSGNYTTFGTMEVPSNQPVYFELTAINFSLGDIAAVGFANSANALPAVGSQYQAASSTFGFGIGSSTWGYRVNGGSFVSISLSGLASGDVVGIAYNPTTGNAWVSKNGVWNNSGNPAAGTNPTITGLTLTNAVPAISYYRDAVNFIDPRGNFGQRPFAYTPPTGFKALNTQNLPEPTIKKGNQWFDATTYTGTGASRSVTNAGGFQPDLVWAKGRNGVYNNVLQDAVRGAGLTLQSDQTAAEVNEGTSGLTSFNSNGFTIGGSSGGWNANNVAYVAWQWKESASAGFDIVTYTGNGANRTVAHSLGVAPSMMIVKGRTTASQNWIVWHKTFLGTEYISLNTTDSKLSSAGPWNSTTPTSAVFSLGTSPSTNNNTDTYVAYCFSEVAGFSKFGSYTGNGSTDGPFVFCGFRPRFVMVKRTDGAADWLIWDTSRNTFNVADAKLSPNSSSAEYVSASLIGIDIVSNGFKVRGSGDPALNNSSSTYIFAAFAEAPFRNSLAR
jgi:hypothetical protein